MKSKKLPHFLNRQNILLTTFIAISLLSAFFPYYNIDLFISEKIQSINSVIFTKIMWFVSTIGDKPVMVAIVSIISFLLYIFKHRTEAIIGSLTAVGSALSGAIIKMLVDRPRPSPSLTHVSIWLSDKSYPSNHVLVFTTYFGFLLYLLLNKPKHKIKGLFLSVIFILLIASIGISRIYLGVHWASDVLGGYLLGVLWLIFTIRLYNSYHGER